MNSRGFSCDCGKQNCGYKECKSCCSKGKQKPHDKGFGPYSSYMCVSTKGFKGKCGGYEQKCIKKCCCDKMGCKRSKCECENKYSRY